MDADRFDALSRALTDTPSRRTLLRLLAGSAVGSLLGLSTRSTEARKKKKKKKKKKKRCTPRCAGKSCGPNGCGGSCGSCSGGASCSAGGTCTCPPGQELCRGSCVAICTGPVGAVRDPRTCGCCVQAGQTCPAPGGLACCTGTCEPNNRCAGIEDFSACEFDDQCDSWNCSGGVCRCASGWEVCDGQCWFPCSAGHIRRPAPECRCCVPSGESCIPGHLHCCSQITGSADTCTGPNTTCVGREDGEPCAFDEQCADKIFGCNSDGTCGAVIGGG